MDEKKSSKQRICRIALFMIWMIMLTPVYTANALTVTFNPSTDVNTTDIDASISWKTDESSTGKIYYNVPGKTVETKSSASSGTSHNVRILNIAHDTKFQFYIEAKNSTSTVRDPVTTANYHYFTTGAKRDRTKPFAVTGLSAPKITNTAITLIWKADSRDKDIDHYEVYKGGKLLSKSVKTATYTDTGLNASTQYVYKVSAVDNSSNKGPNVSLSATTKSKSYTPITISSFKAEAIGSNIHLTWTTNIASHTRVKYSQNPLLLDQKKEVPENVTSHNLTLSGLKEDANYTVMAESCDKTGNCGNSSAVTVQTSKKISLSLSVDGFDCKSDTKIYSRTTRMDVKGTAAPGADVEAYVNGKRVRYKRITSTGKFLFASLDLDSSKTENEIKVTASDKVSADKSCTEKILLDTYAPDVDFSNETSNLTITTTSSMQLKGNVTDETQVTLYVYLQSVDDTTAPPAPANVSNTSVTSSSITIGWEALSTNVTDEYKFLIYRSDVPGGPIAATDTTVTKFQDKNVSSATTYTYSVSTVDKAGNEGSKSSAFSVTTDKGNTTAPAVKSIVPPNPGMVLTKKYSTKNTTIPFTETVSGLFDGKNKIKVKFVDEAGNEFTKTFSITYDKDPPKIITPTASEFTSQFSPSYTSEISVNGQINKQSGEVWVWVDRNTASSSNIASTTFQGDPDQKVTVGKNGTFTVDIALTTTIAAGIQASVGAGAGSSTIGQSANASGLSVAQGSGTPTQIRMVAVDSYGRKSQPVDASVSYTPCGKEHYWQIKLTQGGSQINTRELLEGVAAYGFGFELDWVGGGDKTKANAQNVRVVKATVGSKQAKKYDFDWISGARVLCKRGNCSKGFVMINFLPQTPTGKTYLDKEKNLSNHRKGECWPWAGCVHLLLEMQIDSAQAPYTSQYATGTSLPVGTQAIGTQKQCIDVKIMLDERIDWASSDFVKGLLENSLVAINATLAFLDLIETPIKYVTQVTLGVCLLSFLSKFIVDAMKSYNCKWSGAISELGKGGSLWGSFANVAKQIKSGMIEKVARMHDGTSKGACNIEFPEENEKMKAANKACRECADWMKTSRWITDKWHFFCDRVMCPSVPSMQHYIYSNWKSGKRTKWSDPGAAAKTAADKALPSNTCDVFNPLTKRSALPTSGKCNCDGTECAPSTSTTAKICVPSKAGKCITVEKTCPKKDPLCLTKSDLDSNGYCFCGNNHVCVENQVCETGGICKGREPASCTALKAQAKAVADINSESSYLPVTQDPEPTISLITGFQTAGTTPAPAATTPKKDSATTAAGASKDYKTTVAYTTKGTWDTAKYKNAKSDCEFVEMGRAPIAAMYEFHKTASEQDKKLCEGGHVPQPACCPFEYMQEWGWGMMFTNEVKMSYCLSNPDDKDNCGIGQTILRGVTGICQPKSSKPKATFEVLDNVLYKEGSYPQPKDEMLRRDVVYLIDLDDSGSAKTIKRAYFAKSEVTATKAKRGEERIEVSVGNFIVPTYDATDLSGSFPARNNADLTKDEQDYKEALKAFTEDLKKIEKNLVKKNGAAIGKDDYEEWFRQIYGILGDPGRQYLAQPAGSFIQSILTLCLSGILSWIVQFKNMLRLLQQCFQTILLTGDGSAGQCRSVISQYVCDLLKDLINCLVQRLGGKGSARVGIGGISGIFASIHDSSQGIMAESQSRYGDRNLFATTFSAENLMHDACIFMFTGEWPTDFGQLFESAAYLPVNSTVWVFPATRRWQAYDPQTGYARYVYKIGYSIFAGSDIHYKLKLVCSGQGQRCPTEPGGKCDCGWTNLATYLQKGRQPQMEIIRHQSGTCPESGDLKQGTACTDEVLVVVEKMQGPVRFDKAVIEYYPLTQGGAGLGGSSAGLGVGGMKGTGYGGTMASPDALKGRAEATIKETGGPPPGLCSFHFPSFAFRCGVDIAPLGSASFISHQLTQPDTQPFGIGDSSIARVKLQQQLPSNASSTTQDNEFTKYFVIKDIRNQAGAKIYPLSTDIVGERLNQNKIYDFSVFNQNEFLQHMKKNKKPFEIKPEHFGKQAPGSCGPYGWPGATKDNKIPVVQRTDCTAVQASETFRIKIMYDPSTAKFSYEKIEKDKQGNWPKLSGKSTPCETSYNDNIKKTDQYVTCGGVKINVLADYLDSKGTIRKRGGKAGKATQDMLGYTFTPPKTQATSLTCHNQPETWTMTLELRDSVLVSGSYQMATNPTYNPDTSKPEQLTIKFKVLCKASTAKTASSGSIKDLDYKTAKLTEENDKNNKTHGLWIEENTITAGEDVTVTDFEWINPNKIDAGFKLDISSTGSNAVLNIDVGLIGLVPSKYLKINKAGTDLSTCGQPTCIKETGSVNSKVIQIKLKQGDPTFTFTGFDQASGLADISSAGIELTKNSPSFSKGVIRLHKPVQDIKVYLNNYMQLTNSFTIDYWTDTTLVGTPATIGFDLGKMGYSVSSLDVSIGGKSCECGGTCKTASTATIGQAVSNLVTGDAVSNTKCQAAKDKTHTCKNIKALCDKDKLKLDDCVKKYKCERKLCPVPDTYTVCCPANVVVPTTTTKKTTTAASANTGAKVDGAIPSGATECYKLDSTTGVLAIKTLGSKTSKKISISGLSRTAVAAVSSIDKAGGSPIVLTAAYPEQYGVKATGLDSSGKVTLTTLSSPTRKTAFSVNIKAENQKKDVQLTMELLPMELKTQAKTSIEVSGFAGGIPDCGTDKPAPCIVSRGVDRIVFKIKPDTDGTFKISNLKLVSAAAKACAQKQPTQKCTLPGTSGDTGVCYESILQDIGMQCFSECSKQYVINQIQSSGAVHLTSESTFCINKDDLCSATTKSTGCYGSKVCCPDGTGKPKPKPKYTGPRRTVSGGAGLSYSPINLGGKYYLPIDYWYYSPLTPYVNCYDPDRYVCWIECGKGSVGTPKCPKYVKKDAYDPADVVEFKNKKTELSQSKVLTDSNKIKELKRRRYAATVTSKKGAGQKCGSSSQKSQGYVCIPKKDQSACRQVGAIHSTMVDSLMRSSLGNNYQCTNDQICCYPSSKSVIKKKGEACNYKEKGVCALKDSPGEKVGTEPHYACGKDNGKDMFCYKNKIVSGKFVIDKNDVSSVFLTGLPRSFTIIGPKIDKPKGEYPETCAIGKFYVPGYTKDKSTCVEPKKGSPGASNFAKMYCGLINPVKCVFISGAFSCESKIQQILQLCSYLQAPAYCYKPKTREADEKDRYYVDDVFFKEIHFVARCTSLSVGPGDKYVFPKAGEVLALKGGKAKRVKKGSTEFWSILCKKIDQSKVNYVRNEKKDTTAASTMAKKCGLV
jgi:hypothetical protein